MSLPAKSDQLLLIFAKNPDLGKAKTRLARTVGDEAALRIYKALLAHTQSLVQEVAVDRAVFYADRLGDEGDGWPNGQFLREVQSGTDLGQRMLKAFQWGFEAGYQKIAIIGTDCFQLNAEILQQAFDRLDDHKAVVGPAKDGGYYLLGITQLWEELFQNKNWSTDEVMPATLQDLAAAGATVHQLPTLSDVDIEADLPNELRDLL